MKTRRYVVIGVNDKSRCPVYNDQSFGGTKSISFEMTFRVHVYSKSHLR